jgi:transcriptional regulator with XRE-family HTH domain
MNQSTYSDIENGVISISEEKLMRIADALEVSREVIEWFNDQVIFNSCVQSGYVNTNHINPIEKFQQLHDELDVQFKSEIDILKDTIKAKDDLIEMLKTQK